MNNKLEGCLYFLGALVRLFDFSTDLYYIHSQEFQFEWLRYLSVLLVLSPSIIFFLLLFYLSLIDLCKGKMRLCVMKIGLGFLTALLEPAGLILCAFGCIIIRKHSKKSDFYIVEGLTRTAGFIEGIFESLPQLILQSYNNNENSNWDMFTVTSAAFSAGGFLYTCIKLLWALDMMRHYEEQHIQKQKTKICAGTADRAEAEINEQVYNEEEAYEEEVYCSYSY